MAKRSEISAKVGQPHGRVALSALLVAGSLVAPTCCLAAEGGQTSSFQIATKDNLVVRTGGATESLLARLAERERLGDTSKMVRMDFASSGADLLTRASQSQAETPSSNQHERPLMGTIAVPMVGRVSVVSQEIGDNGQVEGVNFFSVDNPRSKWDMDVDVDDGAKFEFTRKWSGSGKQPFRVRDKKNIALPAQ